KDGLPLTRADDRPQVIAELERRAQLQRRCDLGDAPHEARLDAAMDQKPRGRVADLALIAEDRPRRGLGRLLEIGWLRHDDVGGLAAAFEADALQIALAGIFEKRRTGAA